MEKPVQRSVGFVFLLVFVLLMPGLYGQTPTKRAVPSAAAGKWIVVVKTDPMNDKPIVTALLSAETPVEGWLARSTPQLVVRCQTRDSEFSADFPVQPGLDVYIVTGMPAHVENAEGIHTVRL